MARPVSRLRQPGTLGDAGGAPRGHGERGGGGGRAELPGREVKRRLAGASQVERRSERPPSEDAEAGHGAPYRVTRQRARAQQPQGAPTPGGSGARVDLSPGTFLIHLRDAGEECPRPAGSPAENGHSPVVNRAEPDGERW